LLSTEKALYLVSSRYRVRRLVYFENYTDPVQAIAREKQINGWTQARKLKLVESVNPRLDDLYPKLLKEN
jgi:putative endonuclease